MAKHTDIEKSYSEARLVYDKYGIRVKDDRKQAVHIFGSSSDGNSVYFPEIRTLIDLGLPIKRYNLIDPAFFYNVDYILLTHEHSDHINISTITKILNNYPNVKFIIHPNMWETLISPKLEKRVSQKQLESILNANNNSKTVLPYETEGSHFIAGNVGQLLATREHLPFTYKSYLVQHGPITNIAIELNYSNLNKNQSILYSSDLDSVKPKEFVDGHSTEGLPTNKQYDIICLEANYDDNILTQYLAEHPGDARASSNLRHISEQESKWYVDQHLKTEGIYIPLHASSTFGTYLQL